ncbi:sigma factor SigA [Seminavis robusta]|uniref:Sigma factor SigA n=1 Tax=Seminavis robusta TaxID=568900 RepID=A0A9N8H5T4_9STRA|nr:sigma factor SigA [Seminavis robusta]|eukprot:Sro151_g069270.1 sigma factor SigA (705) ;mRNA; r:81128-83451
MLNLQSTTTSTSTRAGAPSCIMKGRKRCRAGSSVGTRRRVMAAVALLAAAMVPSACAFLSRTNHHVVRLPQQQQQLQGPLYAGKSAAAVLEKPTEATQVRPRTSTSETKRRKALKARKDYHVDSALYGVDAQVLELLSEHFLYPENISASVQANKGRPKGRPKSVPGAMNYDTMVKFRERQEVIDMLEKQQQQQKERVDMIAPYSAHPQLQEALLPSTVEETAKTSKRKSRGVKGAATKGARNTNSLNNNADSEEPAPKRRKRVVKTLPKPRKSADGKASKTVSRNQSKGGNLDLFKYYRTELLSSDEEYALGLKTQFMMKCEHVHEGLAANLMRLPTIQEWAEACGFVQEDPLFVHKEGDEQIRPAGSENQFEETDPNLFVGNGLAYTAGPGRGRGRAKKPPPTKLANFYDDSEIKAAGGTVDGKKPKLEPINRGTVTQFIEMMMTAKEAKQRMVQSNMRLVVSIARKYSNVGVSLQDLVQEGSLGLSRAAEKFEPSKGFKFSTYASWWIQQAVFRSIAYHSRTIRLPVHVHNLLNRVRKVRFQLESELGRTPTNEEVAEALDMTVEKYNKMLRLTKRSISLEMPKYQSNPKDLGHESEDLLGDTIDAGRVIPDDGNPETRVDRGLFHDDLNEMLEILNEDEKRVICARYGLTDGLTRTVTLVAAQMKESKAWVRSQECRALRKLRRPWYEKKLKEHQDALTA